jgi:ABC-type multidrug transport system permease subunit
MFRRFRAIVEEEIIRIKSGPATYWISVIPVIALLFFGYAIDVDVKSVPTVVFDLNQDAESRQLIKEFENTGYFRLIGEVRSEQALQEAIVAGGAKVGIKVPADYSANLLGGRQGQVQVVIDGSDSAAALQILNSSQQFGVLKSLEREGVSPAMFSVDVRPHVLFNPNLRSAGFFVPGLIGILQQMWGFCLATFAAGRERGTQTCQPSLPVSVAGLILGKFLIYGAIGVAQTMLMLSIMVFLFGVPINGSVTLLLVVAMLFFVPALGIVMVISTYANRGEGMQMSALFLLSSFLLSGFVFPRESMPPIIYAISLFIPATHYLEILRGIILRGAGIAVLWDEVAALAGLGVFFLVLSALRFKKHLG